MSNHDSAEDDDRPKTLRDRIVEVLSFPLDLVRPIPPRYWGWAAHRLATGAGWEPPIVLIAGLIMLVGVHARLHPFVLWHVPHLVTTGIVSALAIYLVMRRASVVFPRYGAWGFTRPRWWFEFGRMLWIVGVVAGAIAIGSGFAGLGVLGPIADLIFRLLMRVAACAFVAFCLVATVAYAISFLRRLPRRGKAFECVQFFYLLIVAHLIAIPPVFLFRADRFALVALTIAVIAATIATGIAIVQWIRKRRPMQARLG